MDVLPPELWGEVYAYTPAPESFIRLGPNGARLLTVTTLVLLSEELPTPPGAQLITLNCDTGDRRLSDTGSRRLSDTAECSFARLRQCIKRDCKITLQLLGSRDATYRELAGALTEAYAAHLIQAFARPPAHSEPALFENIHTIEFCRCDISDVGELRRVRRVMLASCPRLTDISLLGAQQSVRISHCPLLVCVDSLAAVPDVALLACPLVADVSRLGRQTRLSLCDCPAIEDYSTLTRVSHLHIWKTGMTVLPPMENDILVIEECPRLTDISRLVGVGWLRLDCRRYRRDGPPEADSCLRTGLSSLARVREQVDLCCVEISDLRPLRGVKTVGLDHCPGVRDLTPLSGAHKVHLWSCAGVTDVSALKNVPEVRIEYCAGVTNLAALAGVHTLLLAAHEGQPADAPPADAPPADAPPVVGTHHSVHYENFAAPAYPLKGCYRLSAFVDTEQERADLMVAHPGARHYNIQVA